LVFAGFKTLPLGVQGANIDSALNCVYSFQVNSLWGFVHGTQDFASGIR